MKQNRHNRPIASHFRSGGLEFSYFGQDLDEADGESEEPIARITVRERTVEHVALVQFALGPLRREFSELETRMGGRGPRPEGHITDETWALLSAQFRVSR
jgi:hypothetical protein